MCHLSVFDDARISGLISERKSIIKDTTYRITQYCFGTLMCSMIPLHEGIIKFCLTDNAQNLDELDEGLMKDTNCILGIVYNN